MDDENDGAFTPVNPITMPTDGTGGTRDSEESGDDGEIDMMDQTVPPDDDMSPVRMPFGDYDLDNSIMTDKGGGAQWQNPDGYKLNMEEDDEDDDLTNEPHGVIKEMTDHLRKKIFANFKRFLEKYESSAGNFSYLDLIRAMVQNNSNTLEVNFSTIFNHSSRIAMWIINCPTLILPILASAVDRIIRDMYPVRGERDEVMQIGMRVSISGCSLFDKVSTLKSANLNNMVCFEGVVSKRGNVHKEMIAMYIDCEKCGFGMGPIEVVEDRDAKPKCCAQCQSRGSSFVVNRTKTKYRDVQNIMVQERPGNMLGGRAPESKECFLSGKQCDLVRPGDEVKVTGIYTCIYDSVQNATTKFPVFKTRVLVNHILKLSDETTVEFKADDHDKIQELANDPNIRERIIHSIAPSIFGELAVKQAIALSMFGGRAKDALGSHRMRGDINVLILGDPGMAKSQFLKYVERTFHRAVYTTGKGASAVGLTAGVVRDSTTGEWTLEGGAMVLADSGICLIDEFDKMNDQDRTSIHEAMEQQTISISKAGIVASLSARCAVIAAANPVKGLYDPTVDFHENVNLTDPILSRFDLLCVLRTEVDRKSDERLADFVVCEHMKAHPKISDEEKDKIVPVNQERSLIKPIKQELLQKYILYARKKVFPNLDQLDQEKLSHFYVKVRDEGSRRGGMQMTVRHVESMVRIAEANARMELRNSVNSKDVDHAIATMLECFCNSQKHQVAEELRQKFRGFIESVVDQEQLLFMKLERMFRDEYKNVRLIAGSIHDDELFRDVVIEVETFERQAKLLGIEDYRAFFKTDRFMADYRVSDDGLTIMKRD